VIYIENKDVCAVIVGLCFLMLLANGENKMY